MTKWGLFNSMLGDWLKANDGGQLAPAEFFSKDHAERFRAGLRFPDGWQAREIA